MTPADATAPFWPYALAAVLFTSAFIALGVLAAFATKPRPAKRRRAYQQRTASRG